MNRKTLSLFAFLAILAGCGNSILTNPVSVERAGEGEFLKLRAGPGLGYRIVLGLPDGTRLQKGTCTTEVGQLWCKVSLADAPQVTGYVAADYLSDF